MKTAFLGAAGLAAIALASPAQARLQIALSVGAQTFSCFDGQLSCDQSGGANNLLIVDQTVGGVLVQLALAQSSFGKVNELQLSSSNIVNESGAPRTINLQASDTGYAGPVTDIRNSASLTFNNNIGASPSTLSFFADPADAQGAPGTPGTLLFTVSGAATTDPDSFSGSVVTPFSTGGLYSMSENASISLIGLGSVTGFNQSEQSSAVPEPSTWALLGLGFGALGLMGWKKRRGQSLAF